MQVDYQELEALQNIQRIDLIILQTKKARGSLPQRIEVAKVRKKREEIAPKLDQVITMQTAKEAQVMQVEDEDRGLADKQQRTQEEIDAMSADYRAVESRSKDLAGIVKRRTTLAEQLDGLNGELAKIKAVREQVESALALCDRKEADLRASFEEEDNELVERIKSLVEERANIVQSVSPDLLKLYDKTAAKTGGVALGKLEEDRCGVCRTAIDGGHLIQLKSQAPLGVCPNCKRLLIVE